MGPKKMKPPQPGQKTKGAEPPGPSVAVPSEQESILHDTSRENVISVMNRIHREVIDPRKFDQDGSGSKERDFMVLQYPDDHAVYDAAMEVEMIIENCVNMDALVENMGQVLAGRFLLCRTITLSSKLVGVDAGVEDLEGEKAMRLALFNYSMEAKMGITNFETVLPLGTVMIVKNPVFKKPTPESGSFGLIVDNPADVELLSPKRMEELFPDVCWKSDLPVESRALFNSPLFWEFFSTQSDFEIATKLKNVGNRAFVENRSTDAIRFYNLALEYLSDMEQDDAYILLMDILSNKAAALIKLECFNPALICTGKVLEINNAHVKAIYRHAKALVGLGRYVEGGEFVDKKLSEYPSLEEESKDILKLRSQIPDLLKPPGKDIIRALRNPRPRGTDRPQPDLPDGMVDRISEFRGPVELGESIVGDGEGLFATEDLETGTILLVCKPFAALYLRPEEKEAFLLSMSTHEHLVGVMANKIWLDPALGRDLYKLWAGPDLKPLTDDEDLEMSKVDIARITKICDYNITISYGDAEDEESCISDGIWLPSAKINHSCVDANVTLCHHDSALVTLVTTFKQVKKGEEILTSYSDPLNPMSSKNYVETHGFLCKCRLCELDRSENPADIAHKDKLLKSMAYDNDTNVYKYHPLMLARDLRTIAQVERLRAATPDLNLAITYSGIYTIASTVLFGNLRRYSVALPILEKIYAVYLNVPTNHNHAQITGTILMCCVKMKKEKAVLEKWTEELRKNCRLYAGSLRHVRALEHFTLPEELKKFGIEFFNETD
ncbi:uncharacterized protein LOC110856199 [Folsomia candida]|uniref:Peptidyl-prolyl cis-trans isomerase PASTICCINO1 n=1 Tax=Folsomia candida TaxID=158441 RepID=A0A226EUQ2_FOLCA|nr:uncharacterized protein LOC110856199 [Folsomia candida]OXA61355.1 Peptidyl-prolyl cis-trans isomerase PASTICCINO1 [Folsomia candida]